MMSLRAFFATLAPHCLPEGRGAVQVSNLLLNQINFLERRLPRRPKLALTEGVEGCKGGRLAHRPRWGTTYESNL